MKNISFCIQVFNLNSKSASQWTLNVQSLIWFQLNRVGIYFNLDVYGYTCVINPLMPRRTQVSPFTEISILFKKGSSKIFPYERRAYESVDEKSLS